MKIVTLVITLGTLAATAAGATIPAHPTPFKGHELSGQAKVALSQARAVAMRARPGAIIDQELEKEAGGTGLRYDFDVKSQGATYEVGVDALTGRVIENGCETPAQEAQEALADQPSRR
jgi:uncharacterized membrane protein YkoI